MNGVDKMSLYLKDHNKLESGEDIGKALLFLIEQHMEIEHWNFHLTFTKFTKTNNIKIIFDSQWLRVKFMFSRMRPPDTDEISIDYGRLHAPNEEPFMIWNGEECRCWHSVLVPLRFLDGLSPTEAFKQVMVDKQLPIVVRKFRDSPQGKKLINEYPPKSNIVLHDTIWKNYGLRLFELFDLRRPDLWNAYRAFLREYYKLLGMKASYGPPYENVC